MNQHTRASYSFAVVLLLATTLPLSAQELKLRATLTHELWRDRDSHLAVSVAFSGDGKMLASAGRWTVKLWDVATGKEKATLRDGSGFIQTLALSSDGKMLASGKRKAMLKKGWPGADVEGVSSVVAVSGDVKLLAVGVGAKEVKVYLWELTSTKKADE